MQVDTPLGPRPRGCSDYACPNGPRSRLRGLPGPTLSASLSSPAQDGAGGVVVPLQAGATLGARVPANGEALVDQHTTANTRTGLRGERRQHGDDCLASCCRFARQDAQKPTPAGIAAALGELVVLEQVGRLQGFVRERVVPSHERHCCRVMEVRSRPPHLLVRFGQQLHCLAAPMTALLATRDAPLRSLEVPFRDAEDARIGDLAAIGQGGKRVQAQVDAGLLARARQGMTRHVGARARDIPPVCFPTQCDRLGGALQGAGPAHHHPPDLRKDEGAVLQAGAVAELLAGAAVEAITALEAGKARPLAPRCSRRKNA
jgi:hypothetical protein